MASASREFGAVDSREFGAVLLLIGLLIFSVMGLVLLFMFPRTPPPEPSAPSTVAALEVPPGTEWCMTACVHPKEGQRFYCAPVVDGGALDWTPGRLTLEVDSK